MGFLAAYQLGDVFCCGGWSKIFFEKFPIGCLVFAVFAAYQLRGNFFVSKKVVGIELSYVP